MAANTWSVDVDGLRHTISVETNPEARRSIIRVDGRIVAKPMTEDETERAIAVGSRRYLIRRLDGDTFDLDIPPEAFLEPLEAQPAGPRARTLNAAKPETERRGIITKIVVGIVATLFVVGLVRVGRKGWAYKSVPWQSYQAPDGSFNVNFAGEPKRSETEININGDIWKIVSLQSEFRNHFYLVEYVDTHMVVTRDGAPATLNRFFDSYMSQLKAKEITTENTTLLKNPAIQFAAVIPKDAGGGGEKLNVDARIKGVAVMREKRLLFVYTLAASADTITVDRDKFLESFMVLPPTLQPATLIASVDAQEPEAPARTETSPQASIPGAPVTRVYADRDSKMYWPADCPGRPANAFQVPKSVALREGFRLAPACAK